MVRRLLISILMLAAFLSSGVRAEIPAESLERLLKLPEVFAVMREEGVAYGRGLEADMFPGAGGASWVAAVDNIYAVDRVYPEFRAAFEMALGGPNADTAAMIAFFSKDPGARAITLELSARRALLDKDVEEANQLKLDEMRAANDPRLAKVAEFVAANDLIESNVAGGLNASLAFFQGMAAAGKMGSDMSDEDMLSEVWQQEPAIRADTEDWIMSMLVMAYAPLSDAELDSYIAFSRTEAGQALNRALFAGFDVVFVDISRRLGSEAGRVLAGQDL
jgi:hypothetical protein